MTRFAILLILAAALPLDASSVTYEFSGKVDRVTSGDLLDVGDTLAGSFTIDLNTPEKTPTPNQKDWFAEYDSAVIDFQMTAGPYSITEGGGKVSITNDRSIDGDTFDSIIISARGSIAPSVPSGVVFLLRDYFADIIDDKSLTNLADIPFLENGAFGGMHQRLFHFESVIVDWQTLERTQLIIDPPPPPLFGDANGDGMVTAYDLNVIGLNWQLPGEWEDGDFTGDGFVDAADLNALAINWQRPPQAPLSVPEPGAMTLLLIGVVLYWCIRGAR